jgi:hypothetical protein
MTKKETVSPEVRQSDDVKILRDIWYAHVMAEMGELTRKKHQTGQVGSPHN